MIGEDERRRRLKEWWNEKIKGEWDFERNDEMRRWKMKEEWDDERDDERRRWKEW